MKVNEIAKTFEALLTEAQKLRPQKSQRIGEELEWVIYERKIMLDEVNAVRFQCGLPSVLDVNKAERCAMGHVDYTRKFALYCAEIALA
jgi:hypothetical protein